MHVPLHSQLRNKHRGVEQLVARWAHNPKVVCSSQASATRKDNIIFFDIVFFYILSFHYVCINHNNLELCKTSKNN